MCSSDLPAQGSTDRQDGGGGGGRSARRNASGNDNGDEIESCDKHDDRRLELYCFTCRTVVCLSCFLDEHRLHRCHDLRQVRLS